MNTVKFNVGQSYQIRSIGDHNCIYTLTVAKRTEKTLTDSEGKRYGIKVWNGAETVSMGRYSMAGIFHATDKVIDPARIPGYVPPVAPAAPVVDVLAPKYDQTQAEFVAAIVAADWSKIAGEAVRVILAPNGALETRGASELACLRLAYAHRKDRACVSNTVNLGWRFIVWPPLEIVK